MTEPRTGNQGVVVVGAGLGGLRTVEYLRREGYQGNITLVGAEKHPPYDRPPLTKQVLTKAVNSTVLRDDLGPLGITPLLGIRAVRLDSDAHEVLLDDDSALGYDALVLAPGAAPRTLPGIPMRPGLHVVRTIEDAVRLRAATQRSAAAVVVGAGFVGCEVAASLRSTGVEVDLVEALAAPLIRVLGPAGAKFVTALQREHGVRLHVNARVEEVTGDQRAAGVRLSNGTEVKSENVVLGLGVVPEVGWLTDSGIRLTDGIQCTAGGRTSLPDVYAVGDAAQWWHPLAGKHHRVEHWTTTCEQAQVVAANITAGGEARQLGEVPYFWSDQYDVKIQALGFIDPDAEVTEVRPGGDRTVLLYAREGSLCAAVGFSAARYLMRLRPLIASRQPLQEAMAALD